MDNTLENKRKFFAQYFGQENIFGFDNEEKIRNGVFAMGNIMNNCWLELTPLSIISDEDAIEVARISWNYNEFQKSKYEMNEIMIEDTKELLLKDNPFGYPKQPQVIDFLRSKGYALPFMGVSVETMIEWNWIKLKTQ